MTEKNLSQISTHQSGNGKSLPLKQANDVEISKATLKCSTKQCGELAKIVLQILNVASTKKISHSVRRIIKENLRKETY